MRYFGPFVSFNCDGRIVIQGYRLSFIYDKKSFKIHGFSEAIRLYANKLMPIQSSWFCNDFMRDKVSAER